MKRCRAARVLSVFGVVAVLAILSASRAAAVPSFARQTGQPCSACHTSFPELTPYGRSFKATAYATVNALEPPTFPPFAGMVQGSYTYVRGLLHTGVSPFDEPNDAAKGEQIGLPQQASVFYGGQIVENLGALIQVTYNGATNSIGADTSDIRYAHTFKIGETPLILGAAIDNAPTAGDLWNTTPMWRFPYASSGVAPTPTAAALIDGALHAQVAGLGAYILWNQWIYLSGSAYRTTFNSITKPFGAGAPVTNVVSGALPYWRGVVQHQFGPHSFAVGTYGLYAEIFPGGAATGAKDRFLDLAADAQYQYISKKNQATFEASWTRERQRWTASNPAGATSSPRDLLQSVKGNVNYYNQNVIGQIGGTLAYFNTFGDRDAALYGAGKLSGYKNGSPNSNGAIAELDYLPWERVKFSFQYIAYLQYNGGGVNYDGAGRNAKDNNTFYFVIWLAI
jgi:hypothetical protein